MDNPMLFDLPANGDSWHLGRRVGFDLETTSRDPRVARIVSAALVIFEPQAEVAPGLSAPEPAVRVQDWLVNPGVEVPAETTAIHGITTERAQAEGQLAAEAIPQIVYALSQEFATGTPVVVFNAPYDLTVLAEEALRYGADFPEAAPVIDPLVIDKQVDRFRRGKRTLGHLSEHYRVVLDDAHSASADARAAVEVADALAARFPQIQIAADELHQLQIGWKAEQAASLQDHFRKTRPDAVVDPSWPV
ncbi:3'-5' exonuclease [Nesterenkonia sp. HG001]|uniref:3'-5' exonuclease n=1 Tax=Nesterenkonia sp. HG001 TaxID=2983207 RepID=UPI002AC670B9|nr:3'-5' exonuclease [Nesterenkonia sp. HG001]MDZ5076292.1 3'-5' exonuclease [Nesterenkonia sp. HG001]